MYRKPFVSEQMKNVFKSLEKYANVVLGYKIVILRFYFNLRYILCVLKALD